MKTLLILIATSCVLSGITGLPTDKKETRIIEGRPATSGQFPFSAAFNKTTIDGLYFCGGAIVTNQFILTAGHCVDGGVNFNIIVGSNYLYGTDDNRQRLSTSTYILHPEYSLDPLLNDIGLLQLHLPILFNNFIRAIYLPSTDIQANANLFSTGWGQISNNDPDLSDALNFVQVVQLTTQECQRIYGDAVDGNNVCVAGNDLEGTCYGDMGSPLVEFRTGTVTWHVGVASFIPPACDTLYPSGYTRTYAYVDWIHSVIHDQ